MKATLREIARMAQVHHSTASYVLNGARSSTRVSRETRERVIAVADKLGYSPNRAAQQLKTQRSGVVGLLTSELENPFFARLVSLCLTTLEREKYESVLAMRRQDEVSDLHLLQTLTSRHVDGLLVWSETDTEIRAWLESMSTAPNVVVLGYPVSVCDSIEAALHEGVDAALTHLAAQGFQRIGYLAPEFSLKSTGDPRPGIYRYRIHQLGQRLRIYTFEGQAHTPGGARLRAEEIASERPDERPDALLCFNDMTAIGAMQGLRRRGLRVPQDMALVGCDDIPLAAQMDVPLTTITYPLEEMCRRAVQMLMDRIRPWSPGEPDGREGLPPRHVSVPATLTIRESSLRTPF